MAEQGGPDRALERHLLSNLLQEALDRLSAEHRAVIELTYYHGYSYREIAEIVDCPVNTVKTRMFHARRRLQKMVPRLSSGRTTGRGRGAKS